ncbi:MAG: vitamin K epoxide reductase family protein [Anaerolineaceae bacterium]|nr:MAG: vitamin K epoxide reductase family protein [Anaerolineaceae bacterium]
MQAQNLQQRPAEPSSLDNRLYGFIVVVLLAALAVSGYLSYLKLFPAVAPACPADATFDCNTVLNSRFSVVAGVPIAYLGFFTNVVLLGLLIAERVVRSFTQYAPLAVFFVALFAFIYSVYLVYVQAFEIGAYCPWCLAHEALIALIFGAAIWRLRTSGAL